MADDILNSRGCLKAIDGDILNLVVCKSHPEVACPTKAKCVAIFHVILDWDAFDMVWGEGNSNTVCTWAEGDDHSMWNNTQRKD